MVAFAWLLAIVAAAHGYGQIVASALKLRLSTRVERATLTIGFGTGFLMVAVFVLGLLHLIGRGTSLLLIVPAGAFAIWTAATSSRGAPGESAAEPCWLRITLLGVLVACIAANVVGTLAPVSFIDALVYHLFIARTYVQAGQIVELPAIWQSYQPLGVEMLFTLGFSLQGPLLSALAHTGLGVLAAAATGLLGRRIAGPLGGLLAAAIFYCTAMVEWESTSCFVDLGTTAFSALGFYAVLRWSDDGRDEENPRWLVAAAIFMGIGGSCKLPAIQFAVIASTVVGWISLRRGRGLVASAGRVAAFLGISVGICLPWYVHSYVWSGNPVYPFATKIFGDNRDNASVQSILGQYAPGHGIKDLVLAPWRLFSGGAAFECAQYLSPLPFIFAPLILFRLRGSRDRQVLAAPAGIGFLFWFASAHVARYLVPLQPFLAALTADAMLWLAGGSRYRRGLMVLTGAVFIGFGTLTTLLSLKTFAPVVFHRESADAYLGRMSPYYNLYKTVEKDVPPDALILINQGPTYYLDRPHVRVSDALFRGAPDRLATVLDGGRFTHILVYGHEGKEQTVLALGPRVRLLWSRRVDTPLSRTFGGTVTVPAALFAVVH
jgi:hypothetical protein